MLWGAKGIGLAKSLGPDFDSWTKLDANPVIKSTEWGITEVKDPSGKSFLYGSADPSNIWKKDGRYYMLTGNLLVLNKIGRAPDAPLSEQGRSALPLRLGRLERLEIPPRLLRTEPGVDRPQRRQHVPQFSAAAFEPCRRAAEREASAACSSATTKAANTMSGDYRNDRFTPNNHGRMTWVDNTYFAPEALMDGQGRQIMWAWLLDNPSGEKEKGWSGVYGLPRSLWLGEDGTLRLPAGEGTRNPPLPREIVERSGVGRWRNQSARRRGGGCL